LLEDTLGRILGTKVLDISLGRRSLGNTLGTEVIGISLGYLEGATLGFSVGRKLREAPGSDDGTWLGSLLAGMLGETLGRTIGKEVFGISLLCRRLGRAL
jgi:hypothetical protein